ncbi:MAG: leucyl aminopeptidase [Candidatus Margulisbacteria bacterium]|nr:leucyl aminopeptidase [Candidatus Margulisiibacteriota bacterium]MBU1616663.1 leucyl aminopeptidase [Candidatus Margulisiibacteriota bacterium]
MKIKIECGSIVDFKCDLLVVNEFAGIKQPGGATGAVDRALGGLIGRLTRDGEISGKLGEVTMLHALPGVKATKVAIVGLGKSEDFDLDAVRTASAAAIKKALEIRAKTVATIIHGAGIGGLEPEEAAKAVVEGSVLGVYNFAGYAKEKERPDHKIETLVLVDHDKAKVYAIKKGVELGRIIAEAENHARDLVNTPSNKMTPTNFAKVAEHIARINKLKCTIVDPKKVGMEALWAVAKGSSEPPKLVAIEYPGNPRSKEKLALIGKGITFDSGGISLKPSKKMGEMKTDMAGAAAVLGTMSLLADLKPKCNVIGIMPLTENMPSGHATRPGDVVGSLSGYTIEVLNTDAEGRMILADAITYAKQRGATRIIDIATLTGGCIVALGDAATGVIGNDQEFIDHIIRVGNRCGQKMWQLPLYDEYKEALKSRIADIKNTSETGKASPSSGGAFLAKFVGELPWAHLDIAGTAHLDKANGYLPEGATGVPVRTLIEYITRQG